MPLTADALPRTAAIVSRLAVAERTGSTNADLVAAVEDQPSAWPHLAAIVSDDQTHGRGRLGRTWVAPPGAALAVSLVVDARSLAPDARGWIPLAAGAALARAVAASVGPMHTVRVKWPNDVLVDGRKISGILAEVVPRHPSHVVVGAGVNTSMDATALPVPTATSFAVLGVTPDVDALLASYISALDELVQALAVSGGDALVSGVAAEIEGVCGTIGTDVRVQLPGGAELVGEAVRLGQQGELVVRTDDAEVSVIAGDVVHLRPVG